MPVELGLQQAYGTNTQNIDKMAEAGGKWVRVNMDMSGIWPTQAAYNADTPNYNTSYGNLVTLVTYIHSKGMKVLMCPAYNPGWLGIYHGAPSDNTIFARMCRRAVRDMPTVEAWEIWNEPNNPTFWANPSFVAYRQLLRACILDMRAQQSTAYIMPAGLSAWGACSNQTAATYNYTFDAGIASGGPGINVATFMWGLFDPTDGIVGGLTAGTPYVNAYTVHAYTTAAGIPTELAFENQLMHAGNKIPGIGDPAVWGVNGNGVSNGYSFWDDIIKVKDASWASKTMWDTEFGELSDVNYAQYNPWTDQIMADHLRIEITQWNSYPFAGPKIYYNLRDDQSSGNDVWTSHGGLYHADLSPKPQPLAQFQALSGIPDTVPPDVYIAVIGPAFPVPDQVVSGSVILSSIASDNITDVSQLIVKYYLDGVLLATAFNGGGYGFIYTWDTTTVTNGAHTLVAKCTDLALNVGTSVACPVNVQNGVTDITPPNCAWVSIGGQTPTNGLVITGSQVMLVAAVSDLVTPTNQLVVEFFADAIKIGQAVPPFTGGQASFLWDSTQIANGSYSLVARAKDLANNVRNSTTVSTYINNVVVKTPVPAQVIDLTRTDSSEATVLRPFVMGRSRRDKRDQTARPVIICHPYGGLGWNIMHENTGFDSLVLRPIINAGYAAICARCGDGNLAVPSGGQWGNDTGITSMTNARSYLQNVAKGAARPGKIAIVSFSMGGATAWNFTRSLGTGVVAGIIGIDSCTDLSWDRGTDQNHWKGATAASGGTVSVVKSTGGFASYMVGWTIPRPTGNVTITAFTSSTQVSVSPPLPTPITAGEILNLIPPDGAGLFYQNINQAYGGNGAEPDGVMNDAAWNAIKGTRDPSLMVDTRSWMLDIPWFASYGEQDIFTGGSTQQKKLGNKLHTVKYSIDTAGVHGGIYCKPEDLISFLDGLDWG